jgi:hypothetical protein
MEGAGPPVRLRLTLATVATCGVWWLAGAAMPWAQGPASTEYDVKAAFLYNFGKFISWPPSPRRAGRSFDLCILGRDPFGAALDRVVSGAAVGGLAVQARRLATLDDAGSCHILFIAASEAGSIGQVLDAVAGQEVLTVSDVPRFLDAGGIIQFVMQDSMVRFEVDLARAQSAGLTLSSDLLRVAATVRLNQPR